MKNLFSYVKTLFGKGAATKSVKGNQSFMPEYPPESFSGKEKHSIPEGIRLEKKHWRNKKAKIRKANRARMNQIRCNNKGFKKLAA